MYISGWILVIAAFWLLALPALISGAERAAFQRGHKQGYYEGERAREDDDYEPPYTKEEAEWILEEGRMLKAMSGSDEEWERAFDRF